ncbi:MAG: HDOD domain-containing protein [Myxococcota bacterium]|nr:HDOD domain-containing protein [Myxococcota bacterium]
MSNSAETITKSDTRIRGLLRREKYPIPELRAVVDEVFYATQGGPFNVRILASRVEQDSLITQKILTITSNPYYCGTSKIKNIISLIQRFGPAGFRCIALQAFLDTDLYRRQHPFQSELLTIRNYSLACAHIARIISRQTGANGDLAFLCGLLHRIGMSVPLILHPKYAETPTSSQDFYLALEGAHSIFGATVAQRWGMPEEVVMSVANHGQIVINGTVSLYSATIVLAEALAQKLGYQLKTFKRIPRTAPHSPKEDSKNALSALGIPIDEFQKIVAEVNQILSFEVI